jgi:predicted phosphodiesterase
MRIAVVADIHGNVRALRAVMDDLKQVAPDSVVNLGDCVSGPLEAAETADVLISLAWTTIRGNHDRQLLDRPVEKMGRSDAAAFGELKNHHHAWLATLEETAMVENIFLCHGTPGSDATYLLETVEPDGHVRLATQSEVGKRLGSEHSPVILCGHTHVPRIVRLDDDRTVINPGSVGLQAYSDLEPFNHATEVGAPHARYAVLERAKAADPWRVSFRVVAYDWEGAAARAAEKGREDWAQWLRTGYAN